MTAQRLPLAKQLKYRPYDLSRLPRMNAPDHSQTGFAGVTYDKVVRQARELVPALRARAAQAEQLVQRAAAKHLCPVHVERHAQPRATEGWALDRGGYRAHAAHHAH